MTREKYQQWLLPSLSLDANYSQQFLINGFNYGENRCWSPFRYVALRVKISVSTHFKNKANISEYNQQITQNDFLLKQRTADIKYEVRQALSTLSHAGSIMKTTKSNYELSKIIFHNQQQQYRLGIFEYSDLLDTERSLSVAERNYVQSAYELILAQINLQKAKNNL